MKTKPDITISYSRYHHYKRICFKAISSFVAFVFIVQQVTYGYGYATPVPPVPAPIQVTNHDSISYETKLTSAGKLLSGKNDEKEQNNSFAPSYVLSQEKTHEDIIGIKQTAEDLIYKVGAKPQEDTGIVLQKKQSSGGGGGTIQYTLANFDSSGKADQINVYHYANGTSGALKEIISYDISKVDSGAWQSQSKTIKDTKGNDFVGSYTHIDDTSFTPQSIISKTVYSGAQGGEKIDYILSNYDDTGAPGKAAVYNYTNDTLTESVSYNIYGLNIDFTQETWKNNLTDDRLESKTEYTGAAKEESKLHVG